MVWLQEATKNSLLYEDHAGMPTFSRSATNLKLQFYAISSDTHVSHAIPLDNFTII